MIKEFVKKAIPSYIIDNDSYKDVNGKGFVERYLEIFGQELDDEYIPKIENLINQKSPKLADAQYLDYIAGQLGDLPNFSQNTDHYRNLLSFIVSLWKIKGTIRSYVSAMYALGLTGTTIDEIEPIDVVYDDPAVEYDAVDEFEYDLSCQVCSDYILITTGPTLTADLYQKILNLVSLLEPINAKLRTLNYNGDDIEALFISVEVDINGDLVYDNVNDPGLVLTLDSLGNLIISGPNANRYFLDAAGDLYYVNY